MIYASLKAVHVLSVILWVGGMVFAHFFLRPAAAQLEPAVRLRLMHEVLGRFFRAVLGASALVLGSGVWMMGRAARQAAEAGGSFAMPLSWTVMAVLGTLMAAIFLHIRFALYPRMGRALAAPDLPAAAAALGKIRAWVSVNLALGVLVALVALLRWPA